MMIPKYDLLVWICVVGSLQPPRIDIKVLSPTTLKISCNVDGTITGLRKIYRVHNSNYNLIVSVMQSATECNVTTIFHTDIVQCACEGTNQIECNIADIRKTHTGDQWTCAKYQNGIPVYSNPLNVFNDDSSDHTKMPFVDATAISSNKADEENVKHETTISTNAYGRSRITTVSMLNENSITRNISLNMSKEEWETTEFQGLVHETIEITSISLLDHVSNKPNISLSQPDEHLDIKSATVHGETDTFYKKFIIIISASAVAVVLIAASLLICVYRKYHHLSDALEAVIAPVDDTANTSQITDALRSDNLSEGRQSTLDIYESIPMMVLSPMADSYPLSHDAHTLDNIFESGSESSTRSVHFYETVPDSPNAAATSSNDAEADSYLHPPTQVLYESLLGTRTDGNSQYNTIASI